MDTLRRRIKRQEVEARQVPTKHGPAWQLRLGPRGEQTVGTTVGTTVGMTAEGLQVADGQHAEGGHADPGQSGRHVGSPAAEGPQVAADRGVEPVALELVGLVDRLQRENLFLAGQVGFLQAKLQSAEETIRLLEAPRDEPPTPSIVEDEATAITPAQEPAQGAPQGGDQGAAPAGGAQGDAAEASAWWRRALTWLRG